jgi:hypothetical protein
VTTNHYANQEKAVSENNTLIGLESMILEGQGAWGEPKHQRINLIRQNANLYAASVDGSECYAASLACDLLDHLCLNAGDKAAVIRHLAANLEREISREIVQASKKSE